MKKTQYVIQSTWKPVHDAELHNAAWEEGRKGGRLVRKELAPKIKTRPHISTQAKKKKKGLIKWENRHKLHKTIFSAGLPD